MSTEMYHYHYSKNPEHEEENNENLVDNIDEMEVEEEVAEMDVEEEVDGEVVVNMMAAEHNEDVSDEANGKHTYQIGSFVVADVVYNVQRLPSNRLIILYL